jgi:hypothetical protein
MVSCAKKRIFVFQILHKYMKIRNYSYYSKKSNAGCKPYDYNFSKNRSYIKSVVLIIFAQKNRLWSIYQSSGVSIAKVPTCPKTDIARTAPNVGFVIIAKRIFSWSIVIMPANRE